jgi:ring-1,2-phenylacetyl-CoA epoxidase subunit PaaC
VGYATDNRDYSVTIARNFLYSSLMVLLWNGMQQSKDERLKAIAAKSSKEALYHCRHSHDWMIRFGDGTDASHQRVKNALNHLWPYTQEFWISTDFEQDVLRKGIGVDVASLRNTWISMIDECLTEAGLIRPADSGCISTGKQGIHSEHLGFMLAEMQSLARAHPGAQW